MDIQQSSRQGFSAVLVAFLAGNLLGAALALLAAPRPGSETRKVITEADRRAVAAGRKVYGTGKGTAQRAYRAAGRAKDQAGTLRTRLWKKHDQAPPSEPEAESQESGRQAA